MSDDDEEYTSDLTDLPSDEEEESTPSQQKKGKKKAAATYQLRNPLRVPRATTYAAQALFGESLVKRDADRLLMTRSRPNG
jgi:hypothetical protein